MRTRVVFHPLFVIDLVQMMRHQEVGQAIDLAWAELAAALEDDGDGSGGGGGRKGGPLVVPTPSRAAARGYAEEKNAPTPPRGLRQ